VHVGVRGAAEELIDVGDRAGEREACEYEGQTVGRNWVWPVVDLEVQVRATGLAGVPYPAQHLAAVDPLAGAHTDAAGLEVRTGRTARRGA
jgi:hypothetical protein